MSPINHRRVRLFRVRRCRQVAILLLIAVPLAIISANLISKSVVHNITLSKTVKSLEQGLFQEMGSIDPYNQTWLDVMDKATCMSAYEYKQRTDRTFYGIKRTVLGLLKKMHDHAKPETMEALDSLAKVQARKIWQFYANIIERQAARCSKERKQQKQYA